MKGMRSTACAASLGGVRPLSPFGGAAPHLRAALLGTTIHELAHTLAGDSVPKPDSFVNLIAGAVERKLDFVSGLYRKREIFRNGPELWEVYRDHGHELTDAEVDAAPLVEVAWCGFGLVWTSAEMLMATYRESRKRMWPGGPFAFTERMSEDETFCPLARELGFKVWADTTTRVGHVGAARIIGPDMPAEAPSGFVGPHGGQPPGSALAEGNARGGPQLSDPGASRRVALRTVSAAGAVLPTMARQ